jgi:hypothetical protein
MMKLCQSLKKPKLLNKGEYKEQNEPPKRADHKGNIKIFNPL